MRYINLDVDVIDSERFLGSEPVDRATWLCLMRYCAAQENGGRIESCGLWNDRKWQQLVRVTESEARAECQLWEWDGEDVIVFGYPILQEKKNKHLRAQGAAAAEARWGGKPTPPDPVKPGKPKSKPTPILWSSDGGFLNITETHIADWASAYPACHLDRQLASMNTWLKANPAKAHRSNWLRFITNWLSKSQDRGGDEKSNRPGSSRPNHQRPTATASDFKQSAFA